jgi:hypothetical protein
MKNLARALCAVSLPGPKCISLARIDMPAVQLERLNRQIQYLIGFYTQPLEFHHQLGELLEQYADLTFRSGQVAKSIPSAVDSFHVSPIVIQSIERSLMSLVPEDPLSGLALADELWTDSRYEPRLIAASIIGLLPPSQVDQVLNRITLWAQSATEKSYLVAIFNQGSISLRRKTPQAWIELIATWLSSSDLSFRRLGIMAILPVIDDSSFDNLPIIFKIISPVLQDFQDGYKNDLREILAALTRRSSTETVFFLRQMISLTDDPALVTFVRQCLPDFPEDARIRLRKFLQALPR